jgi:hypothetical protein
MIMAVDFGGYEGFWGWIITKGFWTPKKRNYVTGCYKLP